MMHKPVALLEIAVYTAPVFQRGKKMNLTSLFLAVLVNIFLDESMKNLKLMCP